MNNDNNSMKDNKSSKYSFRFNLQDNYSNQSMQNVNSNDKEYGSQNIKKRIYRPDYKKSSGIVSILGIAFILIVLVIFMAFIFIR